MPNLLKKIKKDKKEKIVDEQIGQIIVRIISFKDGLRVLTKVRGIRILSDKYHLLIMADFAPSLGKINGDVVIITDNKEIEIKNISAFYKLQHNEFTLLIDEEIRG